MDNMAKVMTIEDAVRKYVHDGDMIALGGNTTRRKPYLAVREIIRQGIKNLYLYGNANGGDADLLIGAGSLAAYINSYTANSGYTQVSRRYRYAVENHELLCEDYSLDIMVLALHGAALGLPFVAVKHQLGSDLVDKWGISEEERKKHPKLPPKKLLVAPDPLDPDEIYCYIPTPKLDTAIVHVQKASPDGTARIEGPGFSDVDMCIAAKHVIVCCEELIPNEEMHRESGLNSIASVVVDAVVVAPYGAHPSQCANYYDYDRAYFRYYDKVTKEKELFDEYLKEWVYDLDHEAYLEKLGIKRLVDLRTVPGIGFSKPEYSWGGGK